VAVEGELRSARRHLGARVRDVDVREAQSRHERLEEAHLLAHGLDDADAEIRPRDRQRHSREARSRAHVDQPSARRRRRGDEQGEGVEEVLRRDLRRIDDRGQVHPLVPFAQHAAVPVEAIELVAIEAEASLAEDLEHDMRRRLRHRSVH
jgi:hypothetical protein